MKTQGEIEAAICEGISRFEQEYMGRGPKDIHAHLIGDLLVVRLQGVLTAAEQHLVKSLPAEKGRDLLKQVRTHLIETARPLMEAMVQEITGIKVVSLHHDISTVTGEEVVFFTLAEPVDRPRDEEEVGHFVSMDLRRGAILSQPLEPRRRRHGRCTAEVGETMSEPPASGRPGRPDGSSGRPRSSTDSTWPGAIGSGIEPRDLEVLRGLPAGAGVILVSNHADETDMRACLELSRRCGRRFLYMMNREAFDEGFGNAGWWLQRLGAFSVERGGQNEEAKRYAIDAVKRGQEVLVVFPEGEIYYLNDLVQPFKSGVVDIGMQAVVEARRTRPDWTAYLVPMAIKYRYRQPIGPLPGAADTPDGAASLPAHSRRLAPATIGSHRGGAPASPGDDSSSEARPGSSRRVERARAGGAAGGPLARWRGTTRARPSTPGPRRWIGRGGSAPICGAC